MGMDRPTDRMTERGRSGTMTEGRTTEIGGRPSATVLEHDCPLAGQLPNGPACVEPQDQWKRTDEARPVPALRPELTPGADRH